MKRMKTHSNKTIITALGYINNGWTHARVAKKYKVHVATIYNWKKRFPTLITNTLSQNGVTTVTTSQNKKTVRNNLTINLNLTRFKDLVKLSDLEVRTPEDQVKYLVHRELDRVKRNTTNAPF